MGFSDDYFSRKCHKTQYVLVIDLKFVVILIPNIIEMKIALLSLLFVACVQTGNSQVDFNYEILTDSNFEDVDLEDPWVNEAVYIKFENLGSEVLELIWTIETDACNSNWTHYACDNNLCYGDEDYSNFQPERDIDNPSFINPGESYEYQLHVKPNMEAGCCNYRIHLSTGADPTNYFETIDITVKINDANCLLDVDPYFNSDLQIFPNPTTGIINVEGMDGQSKVQISDLQNRNVLRNQSLINNTINVSRLEQGIYFMQIFNEDHILLKSEKIVLIN